MKMVASILLLYMINFSGIALNVKGTLTGKPAVNPFSPKFLSVKVYLEGALNVGTGAMNTGLNTGALIPYNQPFNIPPWNYAGAENATSVPEGVVDWVLVELRDAATAAQAIPATKLAGWPRAFFLKSDGSIVDLNGTSLPDIGNPAIINNLFVVIHHRNHLAVMSATGATLTGDIYSFDFTTSIGQAFGGAIGYKMEGSKAVMIAGDIDHDYKVFVSDYNSWATGFGKTNGYFMSDLDMDQKVFVSDYNKWAINFAKIAGCDVGITFTDSRDGHPYIILPIGSQMWMAENLAYLPSVSVGSVESATDPHYYVYGYEGTSVSAAKATGNYSIYGVLYNFEAAKTACPAGWHLPTDEEWKLLEKNLDMSNSDAEATGYRYSGTVGGRLKEPGNTHWLSPNAGATNASGFSALPGGYRSGCGGFYNLGRYAYFWSATGYDTSSAWNRYLNNSVPGISRNDYYKSSGFSVRCLRN